MAPDPNSSEFFYQKVIKFIQTVVGIFYTMHGPSTPLCFAPSMRFLVFRRDQQKTPWQRLNGFLIMLEIILIQSSDAMQAKWSFTLTLTLPTLSCHKPAVSMLEIFISSIGLVINLISYPPSVTDQFSQHARLFAMLFLQLLKLKPQVHSAMLKKASLFFLLSSVLITKNLLPLPRQTTPPLIGL